MSDVFHPISELDDIGDDVALERRIRWGGQLCDCVDRVVDDGETVYLVEDGKRVAKISPCDDVPR
jgi:hypothetical protein